MFLLGLLATAIVSIVVFVAVYSIGSHLPSNDASPSSSGGDDDKNSERERDIDRNKKSTKEREHKIKNSQGNVTSLSPIPVPKKEKEKVLNNATKAAARLGKTQNRASNAVSISSVARKR